MLKAKYAYTNHRRGHVKRFRKFPLAKAFGRKKAKQMGAELTIS